MSRRGDPLAASAEYGAEFRNDVAAFVAREVVDAVMVPGRFELPPLPGLTYVAFTDPSGGSSDSMTLAIGHRSGGKAILDLVREVRPPFSPEQAVKEFAATMAQYRCSAVRGDRYAGEWPREQFRKAGVTYEISEKTKSDIYRDALPLLNAGTCELLDIRRLGSQLCSLERRTSRGGRDSIDHAPGQHDDVANAALGALLLANAPEPSLACVYDLLTGAPRNVAARDAMIVAGRMKSLAYDGSPYV